MASHRVGEIGLSDSGPSNHHDNPFAVFHGLTSSSNKLVLFHYNQGPAFDFGEPEEDIIVLEEAKLPLFTPRSAATPEMFPAWPMRFHQTPRGSSKSGGETSTDSGLGMNTLSSNHLLEAESPMSRKASSGQYHQAFDQKHAHQIPQPQQHQQQHQQSEMENDLSQTQVTQSSPKPIPEKVLSCSTCHIHLSLSLSQSQSYKSTDPHNLEKDQSKARVFLISPRDFLLKSDMKKKKDYESESVYHYSYPICFQKERKEKKASIRKEKEGAGSSSEKVLDAKTLRRLAQNREAAKKSRLRKKAYVQQLESSRIKLSQLEQDLQRARSQGLFLAGGGGSCGTISPGAAMFDMEYGRWLDDDQRHMSELRTGLQAHLQDSDLRIIVDGYIAHYDEIFQLKGVAAKSDVFHLITGMWTTPAEPQLDPLTEQQVMNIYSLQHSSQQAEEALSQGLEQLQQSLIETIASSSINDGMHHMAVALGKLTNLEGFIRQADNLRQQTLHQLRRILTVRQAARCFLVIGEYYGRLRALSSLWSSRPRETLIISDDNSCQTTTDLQMVMQCSQNQFSNF
ncbi:Transcription factor TGA9 [Camellia lanceoleosa]|uniref:Transcription factor TGA9 n=1 Tax=Camellia lanceoleosa TaxID=1840588 RepID=A0ACC0F5Q8_9ERIC|nr:Transcription factor TGA9 [Camellia lanceoleosa]